MAHLLNYSGRHNLTKENKKMYPNSNFIRNNSPSFPGIHNYNNNIQPRVEEEKKDDFQLIYGITDEEIDSIDLCEFISPGFISFPGKNDGYYGQDPTPDPNTPQPGQPGKPNQPRKPNQPNPDLPGQPGPEIQQPGQAPPEHPGQVQPEREIQRPQPPVVPQTTPPSTPKQSY